MASSITLDPRLPFPDSVGGIFPGPATTQKVYQSINGFPSWQGYNDWQFWACWLGGILAGDWHIWFILPSCNVTLFWPRVNFDKFPSYEYNMWCQETTKMRNQLFKHNCSIMNHHDIFLSNATVTPSRKSIP